MQINGKGRRETEESMSVQDLGYKCHDEGIGGVWWRLTSHIQGHGGRPLLEPLLPGVKST